MSKKVKTIVTCLLFLFTGVFAALGFFLALQVFRSEDCPVSIKEIYFTERNTYVDWENTDARRTIDYLELMVKGAEKSKLLHIEDASPVATGENNVIKSHATMGFEDLSQVSYYVKNVVFHDGSRWECTQQEPKLENCTYGYRKSEEPCPVRLNKTNFYQTSADAYETYVQIHADNISTDKNVEEIHWNIQGIYADGSKMEREIELVTRKTCAPQYSIEEILNWKKFLYPEAENATVFSLSIASVIDEKGNLWENPDRKDAAEAVCNGRMGYVFLEDLSDYPQIQKFTEQVNQVLPEHQFDMEKVGEVQVAVRPGDYCLLRYKAFDIFLDLTEENEISPYRVIFYYNERKAGYENGAYRLNEEGYEELMGDMEILRAAIMPLVFTKIPYEEVVAAAEEYSTNDQPAIVFPSDDSYTTKTDYGYGYLEDGNVGFYFIECHGTHTMYVINDLLWAVRYPY